MINWDSNFKQLLSNQCKQCPDSYFAPYDSKLPHVGCCSHSPVFGLFEIYKMVKNGDRAFFMERIYEHGQSEIDDFTITLRANVHPHFEEALKGERLTALEEDDLKLKFSVCSFFVQGKGCGLNPSYKTSVCRSFICSTIEQQLGENEVLELNRRVRQIREEVHAFDSVHRARLKERNWTLSAHIEQILNYLEAI